MTRVVVVGEDHLLATLTRELARREPDHVLVMGDDWTPLPAVNLDELRAVQIERPKILRDDMGLLPPAPKFGNRAARRAEAAQRRRRA